MRSPGTGGVLFLLRHLIKGRSPERIVLKAMHPNETTQVSFYKLTWSSRRCLWVLTCTVGVCCKSSVFWSSRASVCRIHTHLLDWECKVSFSTGQCWSVWYDVHMDVFIATWHGIFLFCIWLLIKRLFPHKFDLLRVLFWRKNRAEKRQRPSSGVGPHKSRLLTCNPKKSARSAIKLYSYITSPPSPCDAKFPTVGLERQDKCIKVKTAGGKCAQT